VDAAPLLDRILDDEGLTAGLDEAEAMALIRALSDRVRKTAAGTADAGIAQQKTEALCRQARQIATTAKASSDPAKELRRLLGEWTA
jgi:hypothetical protein